MLTIFLGLTNCYRVQILIFQIFCICFNLLWWQIFSDFNFQFYHVMIHTQGDLFCVAVKCCASLCSQFWSHSFSTVRSVFSFLQLSSFTVLLVCVCQKSSGLHCSDVEFLLCCQSVLRFVSIVLNSQFSNCQHCDHIPVIAHCCSSCTRFVWSMLKFEVSDLS